MKKTSTKRIKLYYRLAKPGIIYGNLLTAGGGYLLAAKGDVGILLFSGTLLAIALVIGSACVVNNVIDREIDRKMARTKQRAVAAGLISVGRALVYGGVLAAAGFALLAALTNSLTLILGTVAWISYVVIYGYAKRRSVHATLLGTIPGALPLVAGYCAVTGRIDIGAIVLFLILVFWQMSHFYAIAVYRLDDYKAAGIPVLPLERGLSITKIQIVVYVMAFVTACLSLSAFGYAGYSYASVLWVLGLFWLYLAARGFFVSDEQLWARQMFKFSLAVIIVFSVMIAVDHMLP